MHPKPWCCRARKGRSSRESHLQDELSRGRKVHGASGHNKVEREKRNHRMWGFALKEAPLKTKTPGRLSRAHFLTQGVYHGRQSFPLASRGGLCKTYWLRALSGDRLEIS